jgi:hypothetical protein
MRTKSGFFPYPGAGRLGWYICLPLMLLPALMLFGYGAHRYVTTGLRSPYERARLVTTPALALACAVEGYRAERGVYPASPEAYEQLLQARDSDTTCLSEIRRASLRLGDPVAEVLLPSEPSEAGMVPLVVVSGPEARVEVYPGYRVGISQCLCYPRADSPRVLVLSDGSWAAALADEAPRARPFRMPVAALFPGSY